MTECLAISWCLAARASGDLDGAIRLMKNWYRFVMERHCFRSASRLHWRLQLTPDSCSSRSARKDVGRSARPVSMTVGPRAGEFTDREVDMLELAAGDVPNRESARRLVLCEHSLEWYWKQMFGKLNVHRLRAVISERTAA